MDKKLLVIEDDRDIQEILQQFLGANGYTVTRHQECHQLRQERCQ